MKIFVVYNSFQVNTPRPRSTIIGHKLFEKILQYIFALKYKSHPLVEFFHTSLALKNTSIKKFRKTFCEVKIPLVQLRVR